MSAPEISLHNVSRIVRHVHPVEAGDLGLADFAITHLAIYEGERIILSLSLFAHDLRAIPITESGGVDPLRAPAASAPCSPSLPPGADAPLSDGAMVASSSAGDECSHAAGAFSSEPGAGVLGGGGNSGAEIAEAAANPIREV